MEQAENSCNEVQTVTEFAYLGKKASAGVGCGAAAAARTRCGWIKIRECDKAEIIIP